MGLPSAPVEAMLLFNTSHSATACRGAPSASSTSGIIIFLIFVEQSLSPCHWLRFRLSVLNQDKILHLNITFKFYKHPTLHPVVST
jgi:hypothetical protein